MSDKDKKKKSNTKYYYENQDEILFKKREKYRIDKLERTCQTLKEEFYALDERTLPSIGYNEAGFTFDSDIIVKPIGDSHLGSEFTRYKYLFDIVEYIAKQPKVFVVLMGDYSDNFGKKSPGGAIWNQLLNPAKSDSKMSKLISLIKDKVLGVVTGCHDRWSYVPRGRMYSQEIADACPNSYWMGNGGFLNLKVGDIEYRTYMRHKYKGKSMYNTTAGILKFHNRPGVEFDVAFGAHHHAPTIYQYKDEYGRDVIYVSTEAYKITDDFIDTNLYAESPIASPCVVFRKDKKKMIPFMDIREGVRYLDALHK